MPRDKVSFLSDKFSGKHCRVGVIGNQRSKIRRLNIKSTAGDPVFNCQRTKSPLNACQYFILVFHLTINCIIFAFLNKHFLNHIFITSFDSEYFPS